MDDGLKDRMREALDASGRNQVDVARALGVTQPTISQWLNGGRRPDSPSLKEFAQQVGVDPAYLLFGKGRGPHPALAKERTAYRSELVWGFRPEPADGQRTFGNAAMFSFKPSVNAFVREIGQNFLDAGIEPTVSARFSIIRLAGAHLATWLDSVRWTDLREHVEASIRSGQQVGHGLRQGLKMVDAGEIVLLRISDSGTCGLNGPEVGSGNFAALCKNVLDSSKATGVAGGSFGLGKSTLWSMSALKTVLFLSNLTEPEDGNLDGRFIGRAELVWHEAGSAFDGPGWLGSRDPNIQDRVVSLWGNRALASDLLLDREDVPGTTVMVVGFNDPSADEVLTPNQLASRIEEALARHFWPALAFGRLDVTVDFQDGPNVLRTAKVDVGELQPALSDAIARYLSGDTSETLIDPGDVVQIPVELEVPQRIAEESPHPSFRHTAMVLVRRAHPDDSSDSIRHAFFFRGAGMAVKAIDLTHVCVGAHPFHVAVFCGTAATDGIEAQRAEAFLRAAEPPAHNAWEVTQKLSQDYARGGGACIQRFEAAVRKAVREVLTPTAEDSPDGPRELAELFRIAEPAPQPDRAPRLILESHSVRDGVWEIEAKVRRKDAEKELTGRPILVFNGETGGGAGVRWSELKPIRNCRVDDEGRVVIPAGKHEARFRGRTDPASHPVPARHASVSVDFRTLSVGGDN